MANFDNYVSRKGGKSSSVFTLAEIAEMDNLYQEIEDQSLGQQFCQDLAMSFSGAASRSGKSAITWEQVQKWFWDKHKTLHPESVSSPAGLELVVDLDSSTPNNPPDLNSSTPNNPPDLNTSTLSNPPDLNSSTPNNPPDLNSSTPNNLPDLNSSTPNNLLESSKKTFQGDSVMSFHELAFEARSAKDQAWYDVASFLTYRIINTGELEVRVRFSGYQKEDDEWVNVRTRVRERSIPLEPSECHKVKVGDLVLCFQERDFHAVYHDARVVEIHRKQHDQSSCQCVFVVRYDYDNTREDVHLGRICCRPGSSAGAITQSQDEMCKDENWKMSFLY
ncbi:hypothetical protein CsatB_025002 [Cannabis sativa]